MLYFASMELWTRAGLGSCMDQVRVSVLRLETVGTMFFWATIEDFTQKKLLHGGKRKRILIIGNIALTTLRNTIFTHS